MSPSATETDRNGDADLVAEEPLEPGMSKVQAESRPQKFPSPPTFDDKLEERRYLKGRLAAAFRIFGKYGFDEGVAGHITCRVRPTPSCRLNPRQSMMGLMEDTGGAGPCGADHLLGESIRSRLLAHQVVRPDSG